MTKSKVIKRLKQHYIMEFVNVFLLPLCFFINSLILEKPLGLNSIVAIILNGILLLEGSYFWFKIYKKLITYNTDKQHDLVMIFNRLKLINIALFLVVASLIITNPFRGTFDFVVTVFFLLLSILEHINYFEIQLMYDSHNDKMYLKKHKKLKVSKLKSLMNNLK
jgi:hypothetical protein